MNSLFPPILFNQGIYIELGKKSRTRYYLYQNKAKVTLNRYFN